MRRAARITAWTLLGLLAVGLLGAGALWLAGNSAAGRAGIERLTARLTSGGVRLSGLGGNFPAHLTLAELQLWDAHGQWLVADGIALDWSPLALLKGHIEGNDLRVARLHMERAPVGGGGPDTGPVKIPYIDVKRFEVASLELGAPLAGVPTTLAADGRLQLRSLEDADADLSAARIGGVGQYALHAHLDPKRMDASLSVQEPAGGPLANLLGLPGLGALTAAAKLQGPRQAERIDVDLTAGELKGGVHGTVDLKALSGDLDYSLQSPAMTPRPGVAWERIDLAGTWHGPLSGPSAAGHVDADGLVIGQDLRVAHLVGTLGAQGGKLDGHVTLDGVMLPGPAPRLLAADRLTIDASWHVDKPGKPLEVSAEHRLMGLKMYALTAGAGPVPQEATAALTLHDLTPFAALLHQELSGSATIDARLLRSAGKDSLTLGSEALLTGGKAGWVGLFGPHLTLKLGAALAGDEVTVQNLSLASAAATLTASGNATRAAPTVNAVAAGAPGGSTGQGGAEATLARWVKDLQVRWQIDISNLTAWSNQFAGTLSLSGKVAGTPAALDGDADLKSNLSVRGSPSGPVTADIHARNLLGSPSATLKVGGMLDAAAVDIDASLDRSDARSARLLVNRAQWKSARVAGDLTADADLAQSHGQLRLHIGRLEDFERLTGVKAAGGVDGGIEFSPARGRAQAHLELEGTHLAIGSLAGDLHLQAAGAANAMGFSVAVMLPDLYGMPAALSGSGTLDLEADVLHLASVALAYRGGELSLLAPAQLSFANGVAVDELRMGARKSVVSLSGRLAPSLDLQASLTQVDSDLIDLIAPGLVAAGRLDAELRLQGSVSAPSGYLQIDAVGLQSADDAATGLPAMDIHGRADLSEGAAAVKVIVTAGSTSKATLAGSAALDAHGPLDLKLGGKLDLGLSNPFLEARGLHGSGELTLDAAVTGSAAEPVVTGGIGLAHGALRDYAHGVNLTNIEAAVTGNESGVKIQHFSATAVSGTVGVTGQVDLLKTDIPVDLVITAKNAQPVASSIITANLDADLHVTGTARQRLDVAGTVHVNRATIDIPNSLPPDVAVLDVRRRGQAPPAPSGTPLVIGIDVTVKAPQEVLVQGRGLDAELGGEVHLTGTTDDLQASGGFELQRGWFTLAGSRLQITEGNVGFGSAGLTKRIDPTLDFTAKSTVTDATDGTVTAILHITGLADSPRFEVTSSPASLPPDQIMALLLFGVPADKLTALQAAQIGYAVASLSGVGGGGVNPLVKLQRTLGLDRLTVGTNTTTTATGAQQNSGAAIAAGRYVTKRIYVEGKQTTAGTSQVQVDVDLTKHLQLQTRLGNGAAVSTQGTTPENDPGSSIGLSYHFEY